MMAEVLRIGGLGASLEVELVPGTDRQVDEDVWALLKSNWARAAALPEAPVVGRIPIKLGPRSQRPGELTGQPDRLPTLLTQIITRKFIEARAGELLMFHAAGLAVPESGAAAAFVAASGTGKTTVSRVLGTSLGYLSDETVGVDESGKIYPYPKPLALVKAANQKEDVSPDLLGLRSVQAETWLAKLIILERLPNQPTVSRRELGTIDAIVELTPQTSALAEVPLALARLQKLIYATSGVEIWRYSEAEQLLPHAMEVLS